MTAPVIELRGLARTYPGPPPVPALRPADLVIEAGDYVAVTGPSGSGKSTLLHLLGLLDAPTEGSYLLDGLDTSRAERPGPVGAARQADRVRLPGVPPAAVPDGAGERAAGRAVQPDVARRPGRAAAGALDAVGLGHRLDALPTTLSGGECQRVAIARALVNRPSLLLCDEPTGNLDSRNAAALMELLDQLNAAGFTIVVITHDVRRGGPRRPGRSTSATGCCPSVLRPVMPRPVAGLPRPRLAVAGRGRRGGRGIVQRPGRAGLTMLGTVLGVGAFVAVLGITATGAGQISRQFTCLRTPR